MISDTWLVNKLASLNDEIKKLSERLPEARATEAT